MANYYTYTRPVPGITPGIAWAVQLNDFADLVRAHAHTGDDESRITPAAMNINSALTFSSNPALRLSYAGFVATTPALGVPYRIFTGNDGNLYYENGATQLQLTNATGLNLEGGADGSGFYGDYANVLAQASYSQSGALYSFSTAGGLAPAGVAASYFSASIASGGATKAFSAVNFGIDSEGIFVDGSPQPWLGSLSMDFGSGPTNNRQVNFNPIYGVNENYTFNVNVQTGDPDVTTQAHTRFYWANTVPPESGNTYQPAGTDNTGASGYAVDFYSETVPEALDEVRLAQIRPFFASIDSGLVKGGLRLSAMAGTGGGANTLLDLNSARNNAIIGATATYPSASLNNTFFSGLAIVPTSNGLSLGNSAAGLRWNGAFTNINATGTLNVTGAANMATITNTGITTNGAIAATGGISAGAALGSTQIVAASTPVTAGDIFRSNVVVAHGRISAGGAVQSGFNVASASLAGSGFQINFAGALPSANYTVVVLQDGYSGVPLIFPLVNRATTSFSIDSRSTVTGGVVFGGFSFVVLGGV